MSGITFEETITWFQTTDHDGPIGLTVKFPVPAENVEKFIGFLEDYSPYVVKEEGCIEFSWHRDWKDPNAFWLTERWASAKILLQHLGPGARPGTSYEGEAPLKIMAELGAEPEPAAIYLVGLD